MDATPRRHGWLAALLALLCNGLGHLYAGRMLVAFGLQAAWLTGAVGFAFAFRTGFVATAAAAAALLAFWAGQAVHAWITARSASASSHGAALRVLGLVAFYFASTGTSVALSLALKQRVVETFYVASVSMAPTAALGDLIVVARSVPIGRGAVVMHAARPGARFSDPLLKRVVAVGGDTVEVRDGHLLLNGVAVPSRRVEGDCSYDARSHDSGWRREPCVEFVEDSGERAHGTYCTPYLACGDFPPLDVPPGHVFVLGDHRDHSADSRVYGPIPESSILGRVSWIYLSIGPGGVRWDRIGRRLD